MKMEYKKILIVSICVIIICAVAVVILYLPKDNETVTGPPEITLLKTASSASIDPNTYVPASFFNISDTVWIYAEYENISHNGASDFTISLNISNIYTGKILGSIEDHVTENEKACFYYFNTNESWDPGLYVVYLKLIDNISKQTAFTSEFFNLA